MFEGNGYVNTYAYEAAPRKSRLEEARTKKFLEDEDNIETILDLTDTSGNIISRLVKITNALGEMILVVNNTQALLERAVEDGNVSEIEKYSKQLEAINKQFGPKGKAISIFDLEKVLKIETEEEVDEEKEAIKALGL